MLVEIDVGGELVVLGIFAAVRRLEVVLRRAALIFFGKQHVGEQMILERIARAAEFLDRVVAVLGDTGDRDRPSLLVVFLAAREVDDLLQKLGLLARIGVHRGIGGLQFEQLGAAAVAQPAAVLLRFVGITHRGVGGGESLLRGLVLLGSRNPRS